MAYQYRDKLDSALRRVNDFIHNHKPNEAKRYYKQALNILDKYADHDSQLYLDVQDIITCDVSTDIDTDYTDGNALQKIDDMLHYEI